MIFACRVGVFIKHPRDKQMIFACRVGVFMGFDDEDKIKTTAILLGE